MILPHPTRSVLLISFHHVRERIIKPTMPMCIPLRADKRHPTLRGDKPTVLHRQIATVGIHIPQIPQWLKQWFQLGHLMHIGPGEMKTNDGTPPHINRGMQLHIFLCPIGSLGLLPRLIISPYAETSCIDGNVLSLFLKAMDNC